MTDIPFVRSGRKFEKNTEFVFCWEKREEAIGKEGEGGCGRFPVVVKAAE